MRKMILSLGIKKGDKNDESSPKLTNLLNTPSIRISDTP